MVQISLPPEIEAKLFELATARGENASTYAARLVQEALASPSAEELLAPFRKQVAESNLSDAELDELGESLRNEVWNDRKANST